MDPPLSQFARRTRRGRAGRSRSDALTGARRLRAWPISMLSRSCGGGESTSSAATALAGRSRASMRSDEVPRRSRKLRCRPCERRFPVAKLIYSAIASLDGYVADEDGKFDWAEPDEVHTFINDLEWPVGTYLYGRRLYEVMVAWETMPLADQPPFMREFAQIWRAAEKVVYSKTLQAASTPRTRIERDFAPGAVRQMKAEAESDLVVGGRALASEAFRAGLVDECHLFLTPILVGGGKQSLPQAVRLKVELLGERRFRNGTVYLRYRTRLSTSQRALVDG